MVTIRIMSWNIQLLGKDKSFVDKKSAAGGWTKVIDYIVEVIHDNKVDLIGIMEVNGGIGEDLAGKLSSELNNKQGVTSWRGKVSPKQGKEEYVYLWKEQAGVLGGQTFHWVGYLDNEDFDQILQGLPGWTGNEQAKRDELFQALTTQKYIKGLKDKKILVSRWGELAEAKPPNPMGAINLASGSTLAVGSPELNDIETILKERSPVEFPSQKRPPFIGKFTIGSPPAELLTALFHAPGPGDPNRYIAINNMAQDSEIKAASNGLIMGDFNVDEPFTSSIQVWTFHRDSEGKYTFGKPRTPSSLTVFSPITTLGYTKQLNGVKTSLTDQYDISTPPVLMNPNDCLVKTYDNFYLKAGAGGPSAPKPEAINLIAIMAANPSGVASEACQKACTRMSEDFRMKTDKKKGEIGRTKRYIDSQEKRLLNTPSSDIKKRDQIKLKIKSLEQQKEKEEQERDLLIEKRTFCESLKTGLLTSPSLNEVFFIYKSGISDHIPIRIELTV